MLMILISVKEKRNLLSISIWSCGDYDNAVITSLQTWNTNIIEITSDYSINGNKGLKITQNGNAKFIQHSINDISSYIGKTFKFSVDISNPDFNLQMQIIQFKEGGFTAQSTTIPSGSSTHAEVSATILDDTTSLALRITEINSSWNEGGIFYTDNWVLELI